jgi:hypothetical protein
MKTYLQVQQIMSYTGLGIMDIQHEVEQIKKELVELITAHLKQNKIHADQAQKLAADFLAELPMKDQKDLLDKLKKLGSTYSEMREIYVKELAKFNEAEREHALLRMRNSIAEGNIEHAITVAKTLRENHNSI